MLSNLERERSWPSGDWGRLLHVYQQGWSSNARLSTYAIGQPVASPCSDGQRKQLGDCHRMETVEYSSPPPRNSTHSGPVRFFGRPRFDVPISILVRGYDRVFGKRSNRSEADSEKKRPDDGYGIVHQKETSRARGGTAGSREETSSPHASVCVGKTCSVPSAVHTGAQTLSGDVDVQASIDRADR